MKEPKKSSNKNKKKFQNYLEIAPIIGFDEKRSLFKINKSDFPYGLMGIYQMKGNGIKEMNEFEQEEEFVKFHYSLKKYAPPLKFISFDTKINIDSAITLYSDLLLQQKERYVGELLEIRESILQNNLDKVLNLKENSSNRMFLCFAYFNEKSIDEDIEYFLRTYSHLLQRQIPIDEGCEYLREILLLTH